jgi:hypothetical protein
MSNNLKRSVYRMNRIRQMAYEYVRANLPAVLEDIEILADEEADQACGPRSGHGGKRKHEEYTGPR